MNIKHLNDDVSVAGQISASDVERIAADGFRALICNRPDGEAPDQPPFAAIEAAARDRGLETRYIPIVPGQAGQAEVAAMAAALAEMPGPVLAYCRSGARSETFYNAARAARGA